ncbi:MAG: family 1 glycosylhydrolase [Myxococcota bacterium]
MLRFPSGFQWGTATSAHQVEGGNTGNDWWAWEQAPGRIRDGSTSGAAADWWGGYAERDLAWAASAGHTAHRFGLEWSRLEPEPGRFDDDAIARYRQIFAAAKAMGLSTMVTLNHFTLPRWVVRQGGWTERSTVDRFETYAARCGRAFADVVDRWATLNEPNVLAHMGYASTRWPPGRGNAWAGFVALANQLRAHAAAYAALHAVVPSPSVGVVLSLQKFSPKRRRSLDVLGAGLQDWVMNGAMLKALEHGRFVPPLSARPTKVEGLARSYDWLGCNYYGRYVVQFDRRRAALGFGRHVQERSVRTAWTDWGQPHAESLTDQLVRLARMGAPVYVTENGVFDPDDAHRSAFIVDHVRAVHEAITRGADVRGYYHWSLVDNFEWAEGWSTGFGLLALDRDTQVRTPRPSAEVYSQICRANGIADSTAEALDANA